MVLKRVFQHYNLVKWFRGDRNSFNEKHRTVLYKLISVVLWFVLIPLHLLDALGFFYLIDFIRRGILRTRKLNITELIAVQFVFGSTYNWNNIRIRESSWLAKMGAKSAEKKHLGFVLFRTINFSRPLNCKENMMDCAWLVHEVTHVIQFKEIGVQYIIEALRAQNTAGYNYFGDDGLKRAKNLASFNLEQQADIARDYFLKCKKEQDVSLYRPFIEEIRRRKF